MLLPVFLVLPCHPGRGDALRWAPFLSDKKWGNALSGFSSILASQNGPQRSVPRQAGKPAPETLEEDDPSRREPIRCTLPLTISTPSDIVSPSKWRGRRRAEISSCPERDVFGASILQLPSAVPLPSCPGHDRDGTLPLQRTQAARRYVQALAHFWCHARTLRNGQLLHTPPNMPPGCTRPVFRSACVAVALLSGAAHFALQAGWNRGV